MNPGPPDRAASSADSLEFEITDFIDAKQALDELPAGVSKIPTYAPDYWLSRRRKTMPTDRAMTGVTIDWVLGLPPSLRPKATCERFPRVANAIAAVWALPAERKALLDRMLNDERTGREGFPAAVRAELKALADAI